MTPSLSVSLVLQPPSLHNIPKNSVTRGVVNRSRCGTSSSIKSFPSSSSLSQIQPLCYSITSSISHATTEFLKGSSNMSSPSETHMQASFNVDTDESSSSSISLPSVISDNKCHACKSNQSELNINGPNGSLWKAISRVKQTITETPHLINSITMSEYWSSLRFPQVQENQDQKQFHIDPSTLEDNQHMKLTVNTTSIPLYSSHPGLSSASSPDSLNNMNHNYFNSSVPTVDSTPALSPSSEIFCSRPNSLADNLPLAAQQSLQSPPCNEKRQSIKPKFFICDDSGSDTDDEELTADALDCSVITLSTDQILVKNHDDGDCEDFDSSDESSDNEDQDCFFGKISSSYYNHANSTPLSQCTPLGGRRQSLLSDLFMAEKNQKSKTVHPLSSPCHSSPNSDGESSAVHLASTPMSQVYPAYLQQSNRCEYSSRHFNFTQGQDNLKPALARTKKVYKNLAEMGKLSSPILPENSASVSISPCAAKVSNCPTATTSTTTILTASTINNNLKIEPSTPIISSTGPSHSTCTFPVSIKSRSRIQVQGQIQSLVAQSTSTAHRAFVSASATLTDVLFRTSH